MTREDPPEPEALAARLRLELDKTDRASCEETVDVASGEADEPLSRATARQGLSERLERFQARFGLSGANRWVLAAVAVAVAAAGLFATFLSWPRSEPAATASVDPTASAETPAETIVVSVAGAVERPGIVELEQGERVADAIEAAGGLVDGADPGFLNLAREVADGDLVAVPDAGDEQAAPGAAGSAGGPVNINAADAQTLTSLPGIGPVLAERIVSYRESNGSFQSLEELAEVRGIGSSLLEQLEDQVVL